MKRRLRWLAMLLVSVALAASAASRVTVQNLRQWSAPDQTRLVFDLSAPLQHRVSTLTNPPRLVIDLQRAALGGTLPPPDTRGPLLAGMRVTKEKNDVRIVLDLKAAVRPKSFLLKPAGPYGHRLVVDLFDARAADEEATEDAAPAVTATARPIERDLIVAVDAGHGGEDPGAMGRRYRTREKDVTLAIARELARQVNASAGMRAVLIRDGDYYVALDRRFKRARAHQADLFISIHADAVPGRNAYGSSVYALSDRGATHGLARFLADKENASDLIGGVSLNDKEPMVRKVLADLSQSKSIEHSLELGEDILRELRRVGPVHISRVAQAGFAVLKAPDIPSVLVETAFISNPSEEKKLRTPAFQRDLAAGILAGVKRYRARHQPVAPIAVPVQAQRPASREHVVQSGETLSTIARHYNVHIEVLKLLNNLADAEPPIGTRLRIPFADRES
jgi:N-acetylmuramoyl-L-alanine amidase